MLNKRLLICRGISGSGKTTWAETFAQENRNFQNFNRDNIRTMLCGSREIWTQGEKFENLVTKIQLAGVEAALKSGYSVVVSDTNLSKRAFEQWVNLARKLNVELELNDSFLDVPLEVCLERDAKRSHPVGEVVIRKQFKMLRSLPKLEDYSKVEPILHVNNPELPPAICCDLDNTLALIERDNKLASNYRNPYDTSKCENDLVNTSVKNVLKLYNQAGYYIYLVSGREDKFKKQTQNWLSKNGICYDNLIMRKSGDFRKDFVIKYEMYKDIITKCHFVEVILDDRISVVDHLRSVGFNVWAVNEGDF